MARKLFPTTVWCSGWFAVWLLASSLVPAEAGVKLAFKRTPGETSRYQREQKTAQLLTIAGSNVETSASTFAMLKFTSGQPDAKGQIEVVEQYEVLQSNLNISGLTYNFDSVNLNVDPAEPALLPIANLLRATFRTPITMVISKEGDIAEVRIPDSVKAEVHPSLVSQFDPERRKAAAKQVLQIFPDEAVEVGAKWQRTIQADLGGDQTMTFEMEYEYVGPVTEQGQPLHKIVGKYLGVTYSMAPGAESPVKVTGSELKPTEGASEFLFDTERGAIFSEKSKVRVEGSLTLTVGAQELPGKLDLTLESQSTRQP